MLANALLSEMVRPDIAIITRISNAHAEFFESLSEIAEAKLKFSGHGCVWHRHSATR